LHEVEDAVGEALGVKVVPPVMFRVPARVRELAGLPWWSRSQPAGVLVRRSPKRSFSRVRGGIKVVGGVIGEVEGGEVGGEAGAAGDGAVAPEPGERVDPGAVLGGDGGGPDEAGGDLGGRAERSGKFDVSIHGEVFCARLFRVSSRHFGRLVTGWREGAS
jgi:hypothetical protein